MQTFILAELIDGGAAVALTRADGTQNRFHAVWLRDNALDAETRAEANGQRLITLADIPQTTRLASASLNGAGELSLVFQPEDKTVSFPSAWLEAHAYDKPPSPQPGWLEAGIETWDGTLNGAIPNADLETAKSDRTVLAGWLAAIRRYGFAKMTGGPIKSGALLKVVELFGYVRETNYGKWFEVRAEVNPSNLAFTGLGLQGHTDNPYRDPVPTLQIENE